MANNLLYRTDIYNAVYGVIREYWCQYHGIEVDGNSHCEAYTSINSIKNVLTLEPLTKLDYG